MAKKAKSPAQSTAFGPIIQVWSDIKTNKSLHAVFGIALTFIAGFAWLSSMSSLLSWTADYSAYEGGFGQILWDPNVQLANTFGKLGAAVGFYLTVKSFGWTFLLPMTWLILLGLKWGLHIPFKPATWLRRFMVWTLLFGMGTALLPFDISDVYVGNLGHYFAFWSIQTLGLAGAWLAWLGMTSAHVIWLFKMTPQTWRSPKEQVPWDDSELQDEVDGATPLSENQSEEVEWNLHAEEDQETPLGPLSDLIPAFPAETDTSLLPLHPDVDLSLGTVEPIPMQSEAFEENAHEAPKGSLASAFDPRADLSRYQFPKLSLLVDMPTGNARVDAEELEANKERIIETLRNYKIEISKIKAAVGPTVTLYEIVPEAGIRISKIKSLEDDIALSLSALGIRIIAPIPGRGTIGIEVPNRSPQMVSMKAVLSSEKFQNTTMDLPIALGKTISNEVFVADLAKMPHLLMAGATGQGKSVGLNALLASILYKKHPSEVKFVLVDPKKVELTLYNKIERHFLAKLPDTEEAIITDTTKVIHTLNSLCIEMDDRYDLLKDAMVRNIKEYNQKFTSRKLNPQEGHRYLPYIILVIDEFADLIMTAGKEVETPIARLAQLARAIGIHLIIATQRPSVNVITGIIKANFPARIAFKVSAKIDSRTILDAGGAEQLIGKGDMLFSAGNDLIRLQCAFLDTPEVEEVCDFIGSQQAYPDAYALPEYSGEDGGSGGGGGNYSVDERDALFVDAARIVVQSQQGSASLLQRKLKLGYNRAGRLIDQLEDAGILGPFEGSKARQVLIQDEHHLMERLNGQ